MTEAEIRRLAILARDIASAAIPGGGGIAYSEALVYGRNDITVEVFKELVRSSYLGHILEKLEPEEPE